MQCGLCAVVAGLFRRAMCIAGSRRGSGESCYQEAQAAGHVKSGSALVGTAQTKELLERRTAEIAIDSAEQNAVFVRISEGAALASAGASPSIAVPASYGDSASRRLSDADRILLEDLDVGRCRPRPTARFLTMHKRRRKRLATRSLTQEPGILDDVFHGQVQCILQNAGNWRFNAFTLETVTGGRSLPVLCVHLFHWYGLLQHFHLDVVRIWKLFALIEEGYHSTNPYHNSIHAADVTQAMHCFLQEDNIKPYLSPLEIMASLIAAVTHDLDHPGVNQPFLVATSNHLAALYENTSVLENHHWRSAVGCLLESAVLEQLPPEMRPELERHISSLILATDITRQQEFLTRFKQYLDENLLDMRRAEDRHFILQIALKCADISNPCRPWDISRKWSLKVCEEFFRQGDYERQLNLPVTPLCDRRTTSVPKIQVGFFKFVVAPLYEEWHRFLGDGLSVSLMEHLRANQNRWEALILQESAEETALELSGLEQVDNGVSSGNEGATEDSGSIDLLLPDAYVPGLPAIPGTAERVGRRHSVPLSVVKSSLMVPRTIIRRESLPNEHVRRNPLYKLEDQSLLQPSSLSLLSSRSSVHESSATGTAVDRPVSAENLLPEPRITSITSSAEASRLSSVLQPEQRSLTFQPKQLTRQQTFPPLQPYVRIRYMSTTSEMARCTEVLMEADSSSSTTTSPVGDGPCSGGQCGTPSGSTRDLDVESSSPSDERSDYRSDRSTRRRASAVLEFSRRPAVDSTLPVPVEHPRRHSVQTLDSSACSGLKHAHSYRHRHPSSAQELDAAHKFYASLTGARARQEPNETETDQPLSSSRSESPGDKVKPSGGTNSICELEVDSRTNSTRRTVDTIISSDGSTTSRRYSTPHVDSRSTDNSSRRFSAITVPSDLGTHKVFFVGTPPDSPPPRVPSASSSENGSEPRRSIGDLTSDSVFVVGKRDAEYAREKDHKIGKLSVEPEMKENVDPRVGEDGNKVMSLSRRCSQGWARRRGSAPVSLMSRLEDVLVTSVAPRNDRYSRRGSVPTDITRHQNGGSNRSALGPRGENLSSFRRASLPQETALESVSSNVSPLTGEQENCPRNNNNNNNNNSSSARRMTEGAIPLSGMPSPRRGSVPADMSELRRDLFNRNSLNGKSRNRKKILRRRSSGGPEMFAGGVDGNDNGAWTRWKRDLVKREDSIPEPDVKRRGSLPIEMVAVSHIGSVSGHRRSSLWRL